MDEQSRCISRPVHYLFDEGSQSVVFRCARGSKLLALARAARAAFEVDGEDPAGSGGWSVIVIGPVEEIAGAAEVARLERSGLRPGLGRRAGALDAHPRHRDLGPAHPPRGRDVDRWFQSGERGRAGSAGAARAE